MHLRNKKSKPLEAAEVAASDHEVVRWGAPTEDPALALILASARARARRDAPEVLTTPAAVPPEFDELLALTMQRLRGLQADAQHAAASHVERVLARGDGPDATAETTDKVLSQASRARAAEHTVETLTEALRIALEAHRAYAEQALALLDETIRHHHRFAAWLEYVVPTITVPEDLHEIGLARIRGIRRHSDVEHVA